MHTPDNISTILQGLPNKPGVYQFYNDQEQIIYVGKAKDLKKRVSSYFQKDQYENGKVAILVKRVVNIQVIVVNSEQDALLLENNLIKNISHATTFVSKTTKPFQASALKMRPIRVCS